MFRFKQFSVAHEASAMKVGMDGVTLGAWARVGARTLDVGCGCGLIGLMAAQRGAEAVVMVEIDPAAAREAAQNAARSPWAERITTICSDFNDFAINCEAKFDSILSNPPFFASGMLAPEAQRAQARHEGSLTSAQFMRTAARLLAPGGSVSVILPPDRLPQWRSDAAMAGLGLRRLTLLYTRVRACEPRRVLAEFAAGTFTPQQTILHLTSPEYCALTTPFYL